MSARPAERVRRRFKVPPNDYAMIAGISTSMFITCSGVVGGIIRGLVLTGMVALTGAIDGIFR